MNVGLVADTHVPESLPRLPRDLLRQLSGCNVIVHAGDLVSLGVVEQLAEVAPVVAVAGNCDPPSVAEALPTSQELQLAGRTIGIHHGHQPHALQQRYIGFDYDAPEMHLFYRTMRGLLPRADIVVFGHFHVPVIRRWENCLFLSPGAIAPTYGRSTFAMLSLGAKTDVSIREVRIERADLRRT